MTELHDGQYVLVKVTQVGFADENGTEGVLWLKSEAGKTFAMRAFSGEVATHISRFISGDRSSIPSVFNMVEELAERDGLHLENVDVYPSGNVLRSDLNFVGRGKKATLTGYRASDAIALASFYDASILLHQSLLELEGEEDSRRSQS